MFPGSRKCAEPPVCLFYLIVRSNDANMSEQLSEMPANKNTAELVI